MVRKCSLESCRLLAAVLLAAAAVPATNAQESPLGTDVTEDVEVRLALIDVFVVDRDGRTVDDLEREDFAVRVYGSYITPSTLDVDCPVGSVGDPRGGETGNPLPDDSTVPGRIVLVLDYQRMARPVDVVSRALEMMEEKAFDGTELMLAVLGNGLRILVPFTSEPRRIVRTLEAMREDRDLFAGNFTSLTSHGFFRGLRALMEILEPLPGRKHMVVFTGPLDRSFEYDPQMEEIAALATLSRTAIYPVDSRGMVNASFRPGGPPPKLSRLATETGGRMTFNTNDLGLAYARARRDLGCRYTLGFYDRDVELDRLRRIHVKVRRPGIRVHYPARWVFRSPEVKRHSLREAARMVPEMFEPGDLRARLFLLGPESGRWWNALIGVSFRPSEFGDVWVDGVLRTPQGSSLHEFERRVGTRELLDARGRVVVLEPVSVKAGDYALSVVVSHRYADRPLALGVEVPVPEIPRGELFVIGPLLGRRAGDDLVIRGGEGGALGELETGSSGTFEPLLEETVIRGQPVAALTHLCRLGGEPGDDVAGPVVRRLVSSDGEVLGSLPDVPLDLERSGGGSHCQTLADWIPTAKLAPGRYTFEASPGPAVSSASFEVRTP